MAELLKLDQYGIIQTMSVDLGDLPAWMGAVGTVGALAVSLWLIRQQMKDRRLQNAERRAAQAHLVAGWMEYLDLEARPFPELVIMVRNGSDLPVYEVGFQVMVGTSGTFVRYIGSLGPYETREFRIPIPATSGADVYAPEIQFRDVGQRRWLRSSSGILKALSENELVTFTEDPGAYGSYSEHPTLSLAQNSDKHRGRKVQ
jgi:hypothetical protein